MTGPRYAIACPERHAAEAGAAACEAGGNALDAALAAAAALAVTYPHNCALGGDLFAVVRFPDGRCASVNASGPAARAADAGAQRRRGAEMPLTGPDPITVPGAVRGWERLHALGAALGWDAALAPARRLAADGVPVARTLAAAIADGAADLDADPGLAALLRPAGSGLREGATLRQPALAATLERIAAEGAGELYAGATGDRLVAGLQARGSLLTGDDLAGFAPETTPPLTGRFRDLTLRTSPPSSSGLLLLQALAALEAAELDDPLGAGAGALATLFRHGMAQRAESLADPRHSPFSRDAWLGAGRIEALAAGARTGAPPPPAAAAPPATGDTVAVVAADDSGLAVSLTQSLFHAFGACVLEPETGILLHNRGSGFSLVPGHPNELTGGRRPAHTLMPLLVERDGAFAGAVGTMGGHAHPQIQAQVLLRILEGATPAEAIAAPRWTVDDHAGATARAETGVPAAALEALAATGLDVAALPWPSEEVGHAQAIWRAGGELRAGDDPRADGAALTG